MAAFTFFNFAILILLIIYNFNATNCLSSNGLSESNIAIFDILVDYQELYESLISDDVAGENFSLPVVFSHNNFYSYPISKQISRSMKYDLFISQLLTILA